MLSFVEEMTTGTERLVLFISKVALVVSPSERCASSGLAASLTGTSALLNILDIIQFFDHAKSSSF